MYYGAPLTFDRPVKAVFSADGSTAYVLIAVRSAVANSASVSILPVAPMIFLNGQGRLVAEDRDHPQHSHSRRSQQCAGG